ncbi:MAG: ribonuclease HI [Oscillospiraceae bacterium]|jgi:ribonuclease HI|nr:ribonuclease HI [Oscillospiraceae bacterium]
MKKVTVYTDGACSGNPGPGGWGAVLRYGDSCKELCGSHATTTNNRMELTAAVEALRALKEPCEVLLRSDSRYLVDGMSKGWAKSWKANGWKRKGNAEALNADLWGELLSLAELHAVTFEWVRGHSDDPGNEKCDALARGAILAAAPEGGD